MENDSGNKKKNSGRLPGKMETLRAAATITATNASNNNENDRKLELQTGEP